MTYDAERRLKYWQNGQNGQPITSQTWFMYDGAGNRVEQHTAAGVATTPTTCRALPAFLLVAACVPWFYRVD